MLTSSKTLVSRYTSGPTDASAEIEFADPAAGGNSSSAEKHGRTEKAVRLSWRTADGKYDPISSAELPYWGVLDVVEACAAADFFSSEDAAKLIQALGASVERSVKA